MKLEEFEYQIVYRKGKLNSAADALSRYPVNPVLTRSQIQDPLQSVASPNPEPLDPEDSPVVIQDPLQYVNSPSPEEPSLENTAPPASTSESLIPQPPSSTPDCETIEEILDDSYTKFLKNFPNSNYNTTIAEHNGNLLKSQHRTIAIPTSLDLDESNPYIQEVLGNHQNPDQISDSEKTLYSNTSINICNKRFFLLYTKVHHFDTSPYADIFETLKNLRNELLVCSTEPQIGRAHV